ncbi:MAG: phosphatidylglycerophosphatase A [Rickettsiales bacterium]|jgi:phosphatidylglycerophosphatase A
MNKIILTFFYIGLIQKAPGTFGSIFAIFCWIICNHLLSPNTLMWPTFLIIILAYGSLFIKNYSTGNHNIDDKSIVLDEVLGQILTLEIIFLYFNLDRSLLNYNNISIIFLCFVTFRIFDITKIFPINLIDQKIKSGFGVMFDDIVAAVFASVISIIIIDIII